MRVRFHSGGGKKGYSELIFKDASARIRRTAQDFQSQLVVQRVYEEREAELLAEEEGEDAEANADILVDERPVTRPTGIVLDNMAGGFHDSQPQFLFLSTTHHVAMYYFTCSFRISSFKSLKRL